MVNLDVETHSRDVTMESSNNLDSVANDPGTSGGVALDRLPINNLEIPESYGDANSVSQRQAGSFVVQRLELLSSTQVLT